MLLADRCYPSTDLFAWLHHPGWQYRLRLKGNLSVDPGFGDLVTTGELARGFMERYLSDVRLLASETPTNLGILQESEHDEPRIIAMNCTPTRAAVRDYGNRWGIEIVFTQMTKTGVLAGGTGRDDVADFDFVVGDHDSIDQQFDERAFLRERGVDQADLDPLAKCGDCGGQFGQFGLVIGLGVKLLGLGGQGLDFLVDLLSAALVLGQSDHGGQIGLGQPLDLPFQVDLATT